MAKTLLQMAGADLTPPKFTDVTLLLIDAQREYVDGALPLPGVQPALANIALLLKAARAAGAPVVHVQHKGRPGGLFDHLAGQANSGKLPASAILDALLVHFGPIWPGRITLGGVDLGDTWRHPLIAAEDASAGLVPFHKLSQWLAYSLIEPLQDYGIVVTGIDGLTGLPEYRNGGLFLDTGVLRLKDEADRARPHDVDSLLVVEWRALTVALLDRVAALVRERLGLDAGTLPLAKVLEGGTWAAGRRLAQDLRNGAPPLTVVSDGTVF